MSHDDDEFPPVEVPYELRCTMRALDDLGAPGAVPSDLTDIGSRTQRRDIVEKFFDVRSDVPTGTEAPMSRVGRPDIYSLHGRDGERAATWYDSDNCVCWFLGVVGQHDYAEFELRAANDELLPSVGDYELLFTTRGGFDELVEPGLSLLVTKALEAPEVPQRGEAGGLLRLEISVVSVAVDDTDLIDLYIVVRTPPIAAGADTPNGWPGNELTQRLAEIATGETIEDLETDVPVRVPDGPGSDRDVRFERELAIVVQGIQT